MLLGSFEIGFTGRKKSLPAPDVNYSLLNGNTYPDEYLFDGVDGLALTPYIRHKGRR